MDSTALRAIGRRIYTKIKGMSPRGQEPQERGAGGDRSFPVDKAAEKEILEGLDALGEPLTVITEESGIIELGRTGAVRTAVIDPIDGSRNAVAGLPFFGLSMAIALGDDYSSIECGYVINLVSGDEFLADAGRGFFMNGLRMRAQQDDILRLVLYEAPQPKEHLKDILPLLYGSRKTRCLGAMALDLAYLASGSGSVFAGPAPSRSFDFAAGYLFVHEAGGVFTDFQGGEIGREKLSLKRGPALLASGNRALHDKALELLHGAGRPDA